MSAYNDFDSFYRPPQNRGYQEPAPRSPQQEGPVGTPPAPGGRGRKTGNADPENRWKKAKPAIAL